MKKTAIVNGKARRIEFSYAVGETISLSNTEVKKPWGSKAIPVELEGFRIGAAGNLEGARSLVGLPVNRKG